MDHQLSPPHHPPHHKMSLPTFARSIPVEVAAQSASTRTSFTRVDNTRPGTAVGNDGQHDDADPNDEGARSLIHDEPAEEEEEIPQIPQTMLQFLLVSGRRRSMAFEPETTVGRVKELVWNTWPNGALSFSPSPLRARLLPLGALSASTYTLSILSPALSTPIRSGIAHSVFTSLPSHHLLVGGKGGLCGQIR